MKHIYGFIPKNQLNIDSDQEEFCMSMNSYIRKYMGNEYDDHKHQFNHGPCVTVGVLTCPKCGEKHKWSMHLNIASGEVAGDVPKCCGVELLDVEKMNKNPLQLQNFHDIFGDIVK